jgi:hypothetical protein
VDIIEPFEVVDAIQEHNAIFQDHSDILTKGTGTHAVIMAVKHIIVKALPLPPYHCTTLKKAGIKKTLPSSVCIS